ncbi:MAG: NRDE family protein [Arachnia sp.]
MCTVIVRVPAVVSQPTRVLAIRDEDPTRPWNPLGPWWPDTHPGVDGVRDARAGGAWLATLSGAGRLAVLLNVGDPTPKPGLASRGEVVLDAVSGRTPEASRRTQPYNLVDVTGSEVSLALSDGNGVVTRVLPAGVHMLVNSAIPDDQSFARVARWLEEFRAAAPDADADDWFGPWLGLLERSTELPPTDDAALIRDNRPWGIPTLSLLFCTATVGDAHVDANYVELARPGHWEHTPGA